MNKLLITQMPIKERICPLTAFVNEKQAAELRVFPEEHKSILGNIYVAQVNKVMKNLQAAFVKIGKEQECFLPLKDEKYTIFCNVHHREHLQAGDQILVQVKQEAMKMKVPCVSTDLNFTGKYLVLTSGTKILGVSSKIPGETAKVLKKWIAEAKNGDYGVIVRTNAADASKEEILHELSYLEKKLNQVTVHGKQRPCFTLLSETEEYFISVFRDIYTCGLDEIVTDDVSVYEQLKNYIEENQPSELVKLRLYQDELLPLYKLYRLEKALEEATHEKVWLNSGGFLMIQQTEAFVSIDVNSGKFIEKKKAEEAYRKVNLEAAKEIARQLRLRNLSGIILIDFINMQNPDHQDEVFHVLANYLKKDPVKARVVDITALQITEVTRKKVRKSLKETLDW